MKKPVILWIVAALFLFCSFPFFGEGNIGAGVTGIVIAAALGVFGYVTMKKAQAAAEAEQKKAEAEARRKSEEEARRKEYAETHEFLTCPVAGVTFDSRQRVLASLYRDSEGVGIDGSLEECEWSTNKAKARADGRVDYTIASAHASLERFCILRSDQNANILRPDHFVFSHIEQQRRIESDFVQRGAFGAHRLSYMKSIVGLRENAFHQDHRIQLISAHQPSVLIPLQVPFL